MLNVATPCIVCVGFVSILGLINAADLREAFYRMDEPQSDVEDVIDAANVRVDRNITFDGRH